MSDDKRILLNMSIFADVIRDEAQRRKIDHGNKLFWGGRDSKSINKINYTANPSNKIKVEV